MTTTSSYLLNQKSRQDRRTYFGKKKGKKPIQKTQNQNRYIKTYLSDLILKNNV